MITLTTQQARAVSLRASGFGRRWSAREPVRVLDHLGAIQLDSVNVLARSQDLVPFSRMGPVSLKRLHGAVYDRRRGFEYWGHAASWLPIEEYRWFIPRMHRMRALTRRWWRGVRSQHAGLYSAVLDRVRAEGPIGAAAFEDPRSRRGSWWDWKPAKLVLEDLFDQGLLMAAGRTPGFARLYDLPERVLPAGVDLSDPGEDAAAQHLLWRGFQALGVATGREAADYYRQRPAIWRPALKALVAAGQVVSVAVEGWSAPAYAVPSALEERSMPRHRPTFLSPFDNLIWERARTERLFGFRYRLEIYVPASRRCHGYYVLPLLADGLLAGRADMKLDRAGGTLRVHALWMESDRADPQDVALALDDLARHLRAERVSIARVHPRTHLSRVRAALRGLQRAAAH